MLCTLKFTLETSLYFPPPILKTTHLPTLSTALKVSLISANEEKLFLLHNFHHRLRGSLASGYFMEKSNSIFLEIICSVAVGSKSFIESVKASLGFRANGHDVIQSGEGYQLRECPAPYKVLFEAENEDIAPENTIFWDVKDE
jgi:hypothetical protein